MRSKFYDVSSPDADVADWVHASLAGPICVRASILRYRNREEMLLCDLSELWLL